MNRGYFMLVCSSCLSGLPPSAAHSTHVHPHSHNRPFSLTLSLPHGRALTLSTLKERENARVREGERDAHTHAQIHQVSAFRNHVMNEAARASRRAVPDLSTCTRFCGLTYGLMVSYMFNVEGARDTAWVELTRRIWPSFPD